MNSTASAQYDAIGGTHDIEFHEGQYEVWSSHVRFKILAGGRRFGKTQVGCWWSLEKARRDQVNGIEQSIGWVIAPTYKVARPIWRKFLQLAPKGWITKVNGTERAPDGFELGQTKIEFKSAEKPENLVAEGLRWVWIDEAGIVADRVWKESIRPALMDHRAPALISGTPKGTKNWFYQLWAKGNDPHEKDYGSFGGPSFENPYLDSLELSDVIRDMIPRLVKQEIFAEFVAFDEGSVFQNINNSIKKAIELFPETNGYCNHPTYCIGIDLGRLIDYTVLYGVCREGHPTGFDRFKDLRWPKQTDRIVNAWEKSGRPLIFVDASGIGDVVYQQLEDKCKGRVVPVKTAVSKVQLVDALSIALDNLEILVPSGEEEKVIRDELTAFGYEYTKTGRIKYGAPDGFHDDVVISMALAAYGLLNSPPEVRLWSMMR